jgi:hypothetical protein
MNKGITYLSAVFLFLFFSANAFAIDSEQTRLTLKGLKGVYVVVEELQPGILKYDKYIEKSGLGREALKNDVETRLKEAGIRVLSWDEVMKMSGRPALYINVNTHENEKYWFGYDDRVELRQVVSLVANPNLKVMVSTWSVNITGVVNIGQLHIIKEDVKILVNRFIRAYQSENYKQEAASGKR